MKLKVMSYNVQSGKNDEDKVERNYDFSADVIRDAGADIIGLNELGRHAHGERFPKLELGMEPDEYLGKKLGLNHAFAPAIITRDGCPYGNGILTRFPILSAETVIIPDPERSREGHWETRSVLVARLEVEGGLTVLVTHFGLEEEEKYSAVKTVLEILGKTDTRLILMGDFNCTPDDPILAPIYEKLNDTNFGKPTPYTWPSNGENRKGRTPFKIDYIFTSRDVITHSFEAIETKASDHKPIVCEIEIRQ